MSIRKEIPQCAWSLYGKKLLSRIQSPQNVGHFTLNDAAARHLRLEIGKAGELLHGNLLALFWLLDESDGTIIDAKFSAYAESALFGIADVACDLLVGKNYDQARRISAELIERQLLYKNEKVALSLEKSHLINLVLEAIDHAAGKCIDIPFADTYISSPIESLSEEAQGNYPGWDALSVDQKLGVIEEVIAQDIRPYVELDAGGVKVLNLLEDREVVIGYEGSCTSCYSATGSTLNAIQQILRAKIRPNLVVVPDLSTLMHQQP